MAGTKDFYVGSIAKGKGKEHFAANIGEGFVTLCGRTVHPAIVRGALATDFGMFSGEREALTYFEGARAGTACRRCVQRAGWQR